MRVMSTVVALYYSYSPQSSRRTQRVKKVFGDLTGGETPVPIPNTEVKPTRADGTNRVSGWESRSLPKLNLAAKTQSSLCSWRLLFWGEKNE